MTIKIFLSHSAADTQLASALVDCLMSSMILEDKDLRCTSVPGHKLPVGSEFSLTLLEEINESSVVIGLITKNAITSSWVLFELGATWGAKKHMKPLVTKDVDLKSLPGPLSGRNVARMEKSEDVSQFLEEIISLIGVKPRTASKTNNAIEKIISAHDLHVLNQTAKSAKEKGEQGEPKFLEFSFSQLAGILKNEKVIFPENLSKKMEIKESNLLELFAGISYLSEGLHSNFSSGTLEYFLYKQFANRLLTFGLAEYEKLPASLARNYKSIIISKDGHRFLRYYKSKIIKP